MKKVFLAILSLFSISFLAGCTEVNNEVNNDNKNTQINADDQQNINTDVVKAEPVNGGDILAVSSACIGCGHCTKTDPEHFEMQGSKAVVISQDNLDSSSLQSAIDRCPAEAISI